MAGMVPLEQMGKFATVVIDPPWELPKLAWSSTDNNGLKERLPYGTMRLESLAALPVETLLEEDALVFCWTINTHIVDAIRLVNEWGTNYWFTMTWVKNGGIQMPHSPMFNAEWCIVGRKGKPKFSEIKAFNTANYWPRGAHSEKPEGFYDLLRRVTPAPRLDIFGRRRIAGFESWGNEAPEGPALPDHYQTVLV